MLLSAAATLLSAASRRFPPLSAATTLLQRFGKRAPDQRRKLTRRFGTVPCLRHLPVAIRRKNERNPRFLRSQGVALRVADVERAVDSPPLQHKPDVIRFALPGARRVLIVVKIAARPVALKKRFHISQPAIAYNRHLVFFMKLRQYLRHAVKQLSAVFRQRYVFRVARADDLRAAPRRVRLGKHQRRNLLQCFAAVTAYVIAGKAAGYALRTHIFIPCPVNLQARIPQRPVQIPHDRFFHILSPRFLCPCHSSIRAAKNQPHAAPGGCVNIFGIVY